MYWVAIYKNGEFLEQFDETSGKENRYEDIRRDELHQFIMWNDYTNRSIVRIFFERPGQKLIYRKRTFMDGGGNIKGVVYLCGWHENVNGTSIKNICYVYEDGHIEVASDRNDLELIPCEE